MADQTATVHVVEGDLGEGLSRLMLELELSDQMLRIIDLRGATDIDRVLIKEIAGYAEMAKKVGSHAVIVYDDWPQTNFASQMDSQDEPFSLARTIDEAFRQLSSEQLHHAHEDEDLQAKQEVVERAVEVFGNREKAMRWLNEEVPALGNRRPKSLLDTPDGREQILVILIRIEHGVFS